MKSRANRPLPRPLAICHERDWSEREGMLGIGQEVSGLKGLVRGSAPRADVLAEACRRGPRLAVGTDQSRGDGVCRRNPRSDCPGVGPDCHKNFTRGEAMRLVSVGDLGTCRGEFRRLPTVGAKLGAPVGLPPVTAFAHGPGVAVGKMRALIATTGFGKPVGPHPGLLFLVCVVAAAMGAQCRRPASASAIITHLSPPPMARR